MRQTNFKILEKRLEKKNAEWLEVRILRQKLQEKEKKISGEIEKLKNQKIELIFMELRKEMKNEKLEVTSESIMSMMEALRNSSPTNENSETDENTNVVTVTEIEGEKPKEKNEEDFSSRWNNN